jgi:hypothetical protein
MMMDNLDRELIEIIGFIKGLKHIKANSSQEELEQLYRDAVRLVGLLELSIAERDYND